MIAKFVCQLAKNAQLHRTFRDIIYMVKMFSNTLCCKLLRFAGLIHLGPIFNHSNSPLIFVGLFGCFMCHPCSNGINIFV